MVQPRAFCRTMLREYEQQWSRAATHAIRHPLRLKMAVLSDWCDQDWSAEQFEQRLARARRSVDVGEALLAEELEPLWRAAHQSGQSVPRSE